MHSAQSDNLLVCSSITHDTNCLDRKQHSESLTDLIIEARLPDLLDVDAVGVLEDLDLFACDGTKDADGESWTWEGVALDEVGGDGEQASERADLIYITAVSTYLSSTE